MRFSRALTLLTPLLLLTLDGRAQADSTATATTFLNFGAATFSGPVVPSTGPGVGGDLTGDATITQAAGYYVPSNSFLYGGVEGVAGWGPATSSLQVGPTTFSLASAGTELTAISSITKDYSVYAAVDRLGTMFSDNGNIEINTRTHSAYQCPIAGPEQVVPP